MSTAPTAWTKDPSARLDYVFDWTAWLAQGETISTHTVTATSGDVVVESSNTASGKVTAWLTGGTARSVVTCHITTSAGRIDERSRTVVITER